MSRALTLQMLAWLEERPRTYAETLEAWKTLVPNLGGRARRHSQAA
jgi:hypothetical protein